MFGWAKKISASCKELFRQCLHEPDVNSRLVFLTNAAVIHAIALWQTFVYLHSQTKDSNYPAILAVLLGGHGVSALGRFLTKRVGEKSAADADAGADAADPGDPATPVQDPQG